MTVYLIVQLVVWVAIAGFWVWGLLYADRVKILPREVPLLTLIFSICAAQIGWPIYLLITA